MRRLEHARRTRLQIGVIGLPHGLGWKVWMDVDRHVELHGRREETIIARVIEEAALGRAVDERTHEVQVLHAAHELVSASVGACIGSAAKPAKRSGWRATASPGGRSSRGPWQHRLGQARDRGRDRCSRAPAR